MSGWHWRAAAFLIAVSITSGAYARGPYGTIAVGNWHGGAYTNDNTGQFTGCIASSNYKSGISFGVMVSPNMTWRLGFTHNNWNMAPGQQFPIVLTFDGQAPFNAMGVAANRSLVVVDMPDNSLLINQFRKSRAMSAFAQGQLFQFALTSTSILLPTLVNCVTVVNTAGITNAGNFTVAAAPKQPPSAPPVGTSLKADTGQRVPAEYQIEAIELATNFILKTALQNPKVLSRAETPVSLASHGAAWKSDEAVGFVRIVPPQDNMKGLDVASAIVGNDAQECKAKFASGRTSELVDSEVVFRGFSSCEDSDGQRLSQYFIVPRKKGGFILFSVVANMKSEAAKTVTQDEKLATFKKAALAVSN